MTQKATEVIGNDLMLFVDGKAIALATSHTLKMSVEMTDTSNKDSGAWASSIPGKMSWETTSENTYGVKEPATQQSYKTLVGIFLQRKPIKVNFGIAANADATAELPEDGWKLPSGDYEGNAYITSIDLNAPTGQTASFSISLSGTGQLKEIIEA